MGARKGQPPFVSKHFTDIHIKPIEEASLAERKARARSLWVEAGRLHHFFLCFPACEGLGPMHWDSKPSRLISLHGYKDPWHLREVYLNITSSTPSFARS